MFLLVPAYPGRLGPKAVKRLCVCVCVRACVRVRPSLTNRCCREAAGQIDPACDDDDDAMPARYMLSWCSETMRVCVSVVCVCWDEVMLCSRVTVTSVSVGERFETTKLIDGGTECQLGAGNGNRQTHDDFTDDRKRNKPVS